MDIGNPTAVRNSGPPNPLLGQMVPPVITDPPGLRTGLYHGNGLPGPPPLSFDSFDSYPTGLQNHVTLPASPTTGVPGTSGTLGNMATSTKGRGRKRVRFPDDTELEQGVGKRRKLLMGARLPAARAQPLANEGFRVPINESGAIFTSPGYDTAFTPTHPPLWHGVGVAGPSSTYPTAPQVVSGRDSVNVPAYMPPHSVR